MTRIFRVYAVLALLCFSLVGVTSCAKAPPTLSPAGVAAYHATRVVKALDILRDAAIDGEAQTPKLISTDDTRKVVVYHRSAVLTIETVPSGWAPVVTTGLVELEKNLAPQHRTRLAPYFALVKTLIQEITHGTARYDDRDRQRGDQPVAHNPRLHPCWSGV